MLIYRSRKCHPVSAAFLQERLKQHHLAQPSGGPQTTNWKNERRRRHRNTVTKTLGSPEAGWLHAETYRVENVSRDVTNFTFGDNYWLPGLYKDRPIQAPQQHLKTDFRGIKKDLFPWQCSYRRYWKKMKNGVFPPFIQTGDCGQQKTCMLGSHECRPEHYFIHVLYKSKTRCSPSFTFRNNSVYEEVWQFKRISVVVGCQCGRSLH